jgi:hypothetical protein
MHTITFGYYRADAAEASRQHLARPAAGDADD